VLLEDSGGVAAVQAPGARPGGQVAQLRLVCLVRAGDGYLIRAVGRLAELGRPRQHVDISFGDAVARGRLAELERAVRHIQRWCDDGTPVDLLQGGEGLALRACDGTEVILPCGT
jgi:hypothetical protein